MTQAGQETCDVSILAKDMMTSCDDIRQFCKKVKRRIPKSDSLIRLQFDEEVNLLSYGSYRFLLSVGCFMCWPFLMSRVSPVDLEIASVFQVRNYNLHLRFWVLLKPSFKLQHTTNGESSLTLLDFLKKHLCI